jgi:putative heme iron utilization protein
MRNLKNDSRASVLFVAQGLPSGDPLNIGRISLMGVAERVNEPLIRSRFLAKHPSAALYADFADFSFWRLRLERAHFVGGFGRISTLSADELLVRDPDVSRWNAAIGDLIGQLNRTHSGLLSALAASFGGKSELRWHIAASDPDGCDLNSGEETLRLTFEHPIFDPHALPGLLERMAQSS